MNYNDINARLTLPERQRSLFAILSAAQMAAHESKEIIYVIHSLLYVDEHADSEHVYGTKAACAILYPKREGVPWTIDASVEPNGAVFFCKAEDALVVLEHTHADQRKVSVTVDGQGEFSL